MRLNEWCAVKHNAIPNALPTTWSRSRCKSWRIDRARIPNLVTFMPHRPRSTAAGAQALFGFLSIPPNHGLRNNRKTQSDPATMVSTISQFLGRTALLALLALTQVEPHVAVAQGACEALPLGRARTDCFIGRARIATQKSKLARDWARLGSSGAKLAQSVGKDPSTGRDLCHGKVAGTRACYLCCRAHQLSASRCLRNCRLP